MIEERSFLKAILERPDDDARKLIYADWLDEQCDPRGEFVRLVVHVRRERVQTAELRQRHKELLNELVQLEARSRLLHFSHSRRNREQRRIRSRMDDVEAELAELGKRVRRPIPERLQQLAASFNSNWLAVVSDPEIEGCGKGRREGWSLHFEFVCDKTWSDMKPTADRNVRNCASCNQSVHFCDNIVDARDNARAGRCIAVDVGVIRRDGDLTPLMVAGFVLPESMQELRGQEMDPVSQARRAARAQASLGKRSKGRTS